MNIEFPIVAAIKSILRRREEKPAVSSPAVSTLVFDSRDVALVSLGIAVIFCAIAVIVLAARWPVTVQV